MKGGEKTDMSYTLSTADKEIANDATLYNLSHIYVKFDDSVSGLKMIYSKVSISRQLGEVRTHLVV